MAGMHNPRMMSDADRETRWLRERLRPAAEGSSRHVVTELVPEGFPAYVRVFHRWYADGVPTRTRTWKAMARACGARYHGELMAGAVESARRPTAGDPVWWVDEGQPDSGTRRALVDILATVTPPDEPVYFGYELAVIVRGLEPAVWRSTLAGLEAVRRLQEDDLVGPQLWWPAEHDWVVCSDYDLTSTYLACGREPAERLVRDSRVEALAVAPDARVDRAAGTLDQGAG